MSIYASLLFSFFQSKYFVEKEERVKKKECQEFIEKEEKKERKRLLI